MLNGLGASETAADCGLYEMPALPESPLHLPGDDAENSWTAYAAALRSLMVLRNGPEGETLDEKIDWLMSRHPALEALSQAKDRDSWGKAMARIKSDPIAAEAWRNLQAAALDENEGFAAGWNLATAFFLLSAGAPAKHGKRMNPKKAAARPRPKRKANPLKVAVLAAWRDYFEDTAGTGTKADFAENWLFAEADVYDLEASKVDDEFRLKGFSAKSGTVRRWLK